MDLCKTELCTGCAACANACPKRCIQMKADTEGFLRPVVDAAQCVDCGACQRACPILHPVACDNKTVAYAAIHKDESIRMESTSGGVFSLLCQWIFDRGGIVFGAAYANDFSVEHRCVRSMDELTILRTAKYAQSRIGNSFQDVKQYLNDGKWVLFSGTPCQVGGLRAFLGKEYERLVLVDLVCHGVPSPAVWSQYIDYRSKIDALGAAPTTINLRSKETGWLGYSVNFGYDSGVHYSVKRSEDPFMRCFVGNLCLRPSCYDCQFKGISRASDFTLGDYWGVWSQLPDYNDGKGTSLVLLHSDKAKVTWKEIASQMRYREVNPEMAVSENPSAIQSSTPHPYREVFMARYMQEGFMELVDELLPPLPKTQSLTLQQRILKKVKRIFHV